MTKTPTKKKCTGCKIVFPAKAFPRKPDGRLRPKCSPCQRLYDNAWYAKNREAYLIKRNTPEAKAKRRGYMLASEYGMTEAQYQKAVERQGGQCPVCLRVTKLVIDHHHGKDEVRALLCAPCNRAIGLLGDNAEILERAAKYIEDFDWALNVDEVG